MKILQFPLARIFIGFLFGILLCRIVSLNPVFVYTSLTLGIVGLFISSLYCQKKPFYKIVATDSRKKRDGAFIEKLGHYDPRKEPVEIKLEKERLNDWISKGAVVSPTVSTLLKKHTI